MIFGYYCAYPEQVNEHMHVKGRSDRLKRLQELKAPEIIMQNELRMHDEAKAKWTSLGFYRESVGNLAGNDRGQAVNRNYAIVFSDTGFDASEAYSGRFSEIPENFDYLQEAIKLPDDELIAFIKYAQRKFDEYYEKHRAYIEKARALFIGRFTDMMKANEPGLDIKRNLINLKNVRIDIDDGFQTSIDGVSGWYRAGWGAIAVSALAFRGKDIFVLFHELMHAAAGSDGERDGLHRLSAYMSDGGRDFPDAFRLMNEAYVNSMAIALLAGSGPKGGLAAELGRDALVEYVILRTGRHSMPPGIYRRAYFSNGAADVRALASEIKKAFRWKKLLADFESIKDARDDAEVRHGSAKERYKHRHDTVFTYFYWRFMNNGRLQKEQREKAKAMLLSLLEETA